MPKTIFFISFYRMSSNSFVFLDHFFGSVFTQFFELNIFFFAWIRTWNFEKIGTKIFEKILWDSLKCFEFVKKLSFRCCWQVTTESSIFRKTLRNSSIYLDVGFLHSRNNVSSFYFIFLHLRMSSASGSTEKLALIIKIYTKIKFKDCHKMDWRFRGQFSGDEFS